MKDFDEAEDLINSFDIKRDDVLSKFVFKTVGIEKDVCKTIVSDISKRDGWETHFYYNYSENVGNSASNGEELECLFANDIDVLKYVNLGISKYIQKYSLNNIISRITDIRFNRYFSGTLMRSHYDHIHSIFPGEEKGVPVLSIVLVLNEDYKGGEFHCFNKNMNLGAGEMLIFPSCFLYTHGVRKILSGTRYSAVAWAY